MQSQIPEKFVITVSDYAAPTKEKVRERFFIFKVGADGLLVVSFLVRSGGGTSYNA